MSQEPDPLVMIEGYATKYAKYRNDFSHLSYGDQAIVTFLLNALSKRDRQIELLNERVSRLTQKLSRDDAA